jgi:hypothetical protein
MQMHKMPDGSMMKGAMHKNPMMAKSHKADMDKRMKKTDNETEGKMPLKEGQGQKNHGANVAELMAKYRKTGKIGAAKPRNAQHAEKMANAIAYSKRREAGEKVPQK